MNTRDSLVYTALALWLLIGTGCTRMSSNSGPVEKHAIAIVAPTQATDVENLAAKEIRRYLYVRTGQLLPIITSDDLPKSPLGCIVVGAKQRTLLASTIQDTEGLSGMLDNLGPEQYAIKTLSHDKRKLVLIAGGDAIGTLYGAYRFAEILGVRFYLHGDMIPDERMELSLPEVEETGKPLFAVRGIQPFHDFPEGPDWWNADDYKAIIAQLPKLRMNFIGLHTYPEGHAGPEPTVWIGLGSDVEKDGTVAFSSKSSYQNTLRGNWGYVPKKTSEYTCGADQIFERDDYGPKTMYGMMPWPETLQEKNMVFNRVAALLREAFEYAHDLGVKTCVGTETPLTIPIEVKDRLADLGMNPSDTKTVQRVYQGVFERVARAYPLDYYWFWTPEDWTWKDPKSERIEATLSDLRAAIAAHQTVGPDFTLATCGWVLGPPSDRALFDTFLPGQMPISCINRNVGFAFVEPGFAAAKGRPKWAIPWMEDDPAMIIPQLWVGRMRRDAADALAYGCTGLIGIHWRTRVLGPNVSALAHAAWEQTTWNPHFGKTVEPVDARQLEGRRGGEVATFPNNPIADTQDDPLYQTVVYNLDGYQIKVPDGTYTVRLRFCEPHYSDKAKRVFGIRVQGRRVVERLDVFEQVGKNRALDYTFAGIEVTDRMLRIDFVPVVELPCIAAFEIKGDDFSRKINCGGPAYEDYEADMPDVQTDTRPRDLPAEDFYADWAVTQFGCGAAAEIGALFSRLDGGPSVGTSGQRTANLPRPSTWVGGPGGIQPDERPWKEVSEEYRFVEELAALRPRVKGPGNLERFDYWLNNFRYLRAIGRLNCIWAQFNDAMEQVAATRGDDEKSRLARKIALPVRKQLVAQFETVQHYLLETVATTGAMGNVMNWQQHLMPDLLTKPGRQLAEALDEELPADARPGRRYKGEMRIIVPTARGSLRTGEDMQLTVMVPGQGRLIDLGLYFRPLGHGQYKKMPFSHVARSVYRATIPANVIGRLDFEYYVEAKQRSGKQCVFPATAPELNRTVVVINGKQVQ